MESICSHSYPFTMQLSNRKLFLFLFFLIFRLFGTKCDKCGLSFSKNDFVMRAKSKIYHIECFRCAACTKQLVPGDEFALRDGGLLYCKEDHDVMEKSSAPTTPHPGQESNNNTSLSNNNHSNNSTELGCMSGESKFACLTPINAVIC